MSNEKQYDMEEVQKVSLQVIGEHLAEKKHSGDKVNSALRSLAAIAKLKGTERAKDATQFAILENMATNKEEFKQYVSVSLPHLNPVPLLLNKPKE